MATIVQESSLDRTLQKILSFKELKKGWHFGEGILFNNNIIDKAILLNLEASKRGFTKTNAFPGVEGEIQITIYLSNYYLEFTIELDERVTFIHEEGGKEIDYQENLSFESCLAIIQQFSNREKYGIKFLK